MTRVSVSLHGMLEESLSQSYVPGAFRMAERSALRRQRETSSYGNRGNRGMTKNKLQRKLCRDWTGVMLQKEDGVAHAHVKESRLNDETSLKADEVYP